MSLKRLGEKEQSEREGAIVLSSTRFGRLDHLAFGFLSPRRKAVKNRSSVKEKAGHQSNIPLHETLDLPKKRQWVLLQHHVLPVLREERVGLNEDLASL